VVKKYHTDLPEELSNEFEKIVNTYYLNEAEAVRDAIRRTVFEFKRIEGRKVPNNQISNKNDLGGNKNG
jgi:metal-responsive CopG/Arc/MetJ family transcriptional regulator